MRFTIVIPTCNRPADLAACLEGLAPGRQTFPAADYEVVVSDDGTSAPAGDLVRSRFGWARHTAGPRRGPAANRNHGSAGATGRWLVFLDDDCRPGDGLLAAYAAAQDREPAVRVLEGRTAADGPKRHPFDYAPVNLTGGLLWSCNFAIDRALFHELGGFCEAYAHAAMEDVDLRRRLERRGEVMRFVPEAGVVHPWRRLDFRAHTRRQVAAQLLYVRLNPAEAEIASLARHLRIHARYFARDFLPECRTFGWTALRCLPLRGWEFAYRGWHFLRRSVP